MTDDWPFVGPDLNTFGGNYPAFEADCYAAYYKDFHTSSPTWPVPGSTFGRPNRFEDGRCVTFWHLVSEGPIENERLPSLSRLERIGWPRELIEEFADVYPAASSSRIVWWRTVRKRDNRLLIALPDFSYVVIVTERKTYVLLLTAYPVRGGHSREKMKKEFRDYWSGEKF